MKRTLIALLSAACVITSGFAYSCSGYYSHEEVSGMNKICYYNHLGSLAAVTYKSYQVCPYSVTFSH